MLENPQTERVATTENPFTPPTEGQASVGMQENDPSQAYDFTYVPTIARIALYDDLRSAPRITEIQPATTAEYIENLASKIYEQAKLAGGTIPYTVIREVTENFIHARFAEIIVSILDQGNTIRFADQGPGINQKEKAQLPGFTSAIEPMKRYIRGVGSGLPIVREYLDVLPARHHLHRGQPGNRRRRHHESQQRGRRADERYRRNAARPAGDKRRGLFPWRPLCRSGNYANSFPSFWGKAPWGSPIW